ncbi:MAG: PhoX family phosphatase [Pseudomonadota bacterium]
MIDRSEDLSVNPRAEAVPSFQDVLKARLSRRGFLSGAAASAGAAGLASCAPGALNGYASEPAPSVDFAEVERAVTPDLAVPEGYRADVLMRWGDPLFEDSPVFDPANQTPEAQARQFGYNNDYIGFIPMEMRDGEAVRGILCVNHEYVSTALMFPGVAAGYPQSMTAELCAIEQFAHGGTVMEIERDSEGRWRTVTASPINRRIHARTPMELTGPAAGHERLRTSADPTGRRVLGTINNCAGGITLWGTYLMAEENFNGNFLGDLPPAHREAANHDRYGVPGGWYQWGRFEDRFDVAAEPREPNRFGWVVEVDPRDPSSTPKKRTALGRFKHEGAESVVAPDGRVVLYMGDDQRFDYVYKFVTARAYDPDNRAANMDLLDEGELSVARFNEDGTLDWLPLVFGQGPLTEENGFDGQGEVLIEARRAADLLGATPMDRPEDVEPDPNSGRAYVMLTNNSRRTEDQVDAANPRADNQHGHIIEIIEPDGDFTSRRSRWDIVVRCGDPADPEAGASWNPATSENGWFGSPDNCAVDPQGRLWVATDGNQRTGANDGVWALGVDGAERGVGRAFFRAPVGSEVCGPKFTPDGRTLFAAVQHPGETDGATYEQPGTRWPDFDAAVPPRPSVVVLQRRDGGVVGG